MTGSTDGFSIPAPDEFEFRPGISMIMPAAPAVAPDGAGMSAYDGPSMGGAENVASPGPGGMPDADVTGLTTMALGEEDDGDFDPPLGPDGNVSSGMTTMALGEEDDGDLDPPLGPDGNVSSGMTTMAMGEEDDGDFDPPLGPDGNVSSGMTTMAMGEEDDGDFDPTPKPDGNGLIGVIDPDLGPGGNDPPPSPGTDPNLPDQPFMGMWPDGMSFDLG